AEVTNSPRKYWDRFLDSRRSGTLLYPERRGPDKTGGKQPARPGIPRGSSSSPAPRTRFPADGRNWQRGTKCTNGKEGEGAEARRGERNTRHTDWTEVGEKSETTAPT